MLFLLHHCHLQWRGLFSSTPTPFNKVLNHTCIDDHGAPVAKPNPLPSPPAAKPKPPPSSLAAKQTPPPSPPVAKQPPSSGSGGDCWESYNYASGSGCSKSNSSGCLCRDRREPKSQDGIPAGLNCPGSSWVPANRGSPKAKTAWVVA